MGFFRNLSVKWKIYLIAIVSVIGFGGYLGFNVWVNTKNSNLLETLREAYFPVLEKATQTNVNLERIAESLGNAVMTAESEHVDKAQETANKINQLIDEIYALEPERKLQIATLKTKFNEYFKEALKITSDMMAGDMDVAGMADRGKRKEDARVETQAILLDFIGYAHAKFSGSIDQANRNAITMLTSGFVIWGVCIILMAVTVYTIARIIINNISKVSASLDEIASGSADFSEKITVTANDEIGKLASSFNALMENLRIKTNDLMSMMQNMHTGLFTILEDETIHREYSTYIEQIFESQQVAGKRYSELLFRRAALGADVRDQVNAAVTSLLGAESMMFEFNSHLLIKEYTAQFTDEDGSVREKIIELEWDAITTDDIITKIMVTVRDVTDIRAMQAAAEEQKAELEIVGQILKLTPQRFRVFADNAFSLVDKNREIVRKSKEKNLNLVAELFANMHTIKGNARTYQLSYITDIVHEAEATYDRLRKEPEFPWSPAVLNEELDNVRNALAKYMNVLRDKLSFAVNEDAQVTDGVVIKHTEMQTLMSDVDAIQPNVLSFPEVERVVRRLRLLDTRPLQEVLAAQLAALAEVARQLEKSVPKIVFEGEKPRIFNAHANAIVNVFSHLLKNSLDHGIEAAAERISKGKKEQGSITISSKEIGQKMRVDIFDDGRGLNLQRLREKLTESGAVAMGVKLTPQMVADSMFLSGVSTAEKLTDVSGRGVGMDAVKKFLNEIACDIRVELPHDASFDNNFVPFKLVLTLCPQVCLMANAEEEPTQRIA